MMEQKFIEEDTHITTEHQNYNVTTLIQYANKLFRVYTHIDNSVTYQSRGKLEYFNGSDFITISTFNHKEIMYWSVCSECKEPPYSSANPQIDMDGKINDFCGSCGRVDKSVHEPKRSEGFKENYRKMIETYEKFMPHEESK